MSEPRLWIQRLWLRGGQLIELDPYDVVVVVGPNNSGKSQLLRALHGWTLHRSQAKPIIQELDLATEGTAQEFIAWLEQNTRVHHSKPQRVFEYRGSTITEPNATKWGTAVLSEFATLFSQALYTSKRIEGADPVQSFATPDAAAQNGIQGLARDTHIEDKLSVLFRRAFGVDLVVNDGLGQVIPLHIGVRPEVAGQGRAWQQAYREEVNKLPTLSDQGDGIRSFATVALAIAADARTLLFIDEPEAFLHPPQARLLGRFIAEQRGKQVFLATHSGDVLRGLLDSGSQRVRVLRLERDGEDMRVSVLTTGEVDLLWSDPLLRHSNILDGLFHERVVVCESDADARFYSAVSDALFPFDSPAAVKPDAMFVHCGGKQRVASVLASLNAVGVNVAAVVDFDILSNEKTLKELVESARGDWLAIRPDWQVVHAAIGSRSPERSADQVKTELVAIVDRIAGHALTENDRRHIADIARKSSAWSLAKEQGISFVPAGGPTQACTRLLDALTKIGVFVVQQGELECFDRTISLHGPAWVNQAVTRNLANAPEYELARRFVQSVLAH